MDIISQDWFQALVEEMSATITERSFNARWETVQCYHEIGTAILKENDNFERCKIYGQQIVQTVAEFLNKKPRVIYYAVQFAKMFPDIDSLKEGKNVSWSKICKEILPRHSTDCSHAEREKVTIEICKKCKKKIIE